ncbi:ABC transporter permease [soil metagenome]|nr:ABC transporter permease [Gemmatimonadaceae bacterium]
MSPAVDAQEGGAGSAIVAPASAGAKMRGRFGRSMYVRIGLTVSLLLTLTALLGPYLIDTDPTRMNFREILQPPSATYVFGTDDFGRDVFSRVVHGTRVSLLVGFTVAFASMILGLVIGTVSALYSRIDDVLMRVMDILMSFPAILLAIGILAVLGPRLSNIILALVVVYTPRAARVVRGVVLGLKEEVFVDAARALGTSTLRLVLKHLIPNAMPPLIVHQTFVFAAAVLAEAALNFLGVGVPPEIPTLGGILSDARNNLRFAPWLSLYPGIVISLLVLGFNLLGDGLRDVLDPRMRL